MIDVLLQIITTTAFILGAVFLSAVAVIIAAYVVLAVAGLVMLARQARGDYETEDEEDEGEDD